MAYQTRNISGVVKTANRTELFQAMSRVGGAGGEIAIELLDNAKANSNEWFWHHSVGDFRFSKNHPNRSNYRPA